MGIHWSVIRALAKRPFQVVMTDDRRSYRGIDLLVGSLHAATAIDRSCRTDTVAILLPTSGAFPIVALAAWSLGKTVVPLNYLLSREELEYVIADCGCDTIITAGPMLDFLGYEPAGAKLLRLEEVSFKGFPTPRWPAGADKDDLAALLYTSGTSGKPKGVMLTHANLHANIRQTTQIAEFSKSDVLLGVLPQFHSFGFTVLTLLPLIVGIRTHLLARFVPAQILQAIRTHRPTTFVGIPSMYGALLRLKSATREDFACFRLMVSGAEPLPMDIADRFRERFGQTIHEGYGLTETSPVTNVNLPGRPKLGTVGPPVCDLEQIVVCLDTGKTMPRGCEGEIRVRGPNVFAGYYHHPQQTAEAFDEQGFFRTGDIGTVDDDNSLRITGRHKEMLIVAGENVFPREIEEALNRHPSVAASGVVGMIDGIRGEVPMAFIELDEDATFDESALREHCRGLLAGYKVPREIRVIDQLPRSPTGKILRRELKELVENPAKAG